MVQRVLRHAAIQEKLIVLMSVLKVASAQMGWWSWEAAASIPMTAHQTMGQQSHLRTQHHHTRQQSQGTTRQSQGTTRQNRGTTRQNRGSTQQIIPLIPPAILPLLTHPAILPLLTPPATLHHQTLIQLNHHTLPIPVTPTRTTHMSHMIRTIHIHSTTANSMKMNTADPTTAPTMNIVDQAVLCHTHQVILHHILLAIHHHTPHLLATLLPATPLQATLRSTPQSLPLSHM